MKHSAMIEIDKRSRLEVADVPRHRYGKNLRLYYNKFLEIHGLKLIDDLSYNDKIRLDSFFRWLDSTDIQLAECSRKLLEEDVVEYLNSEVDRSKYEVKIDSQGLFRHAKSGDLLDTMQKKWLFVQRGESMFASEKRTVSPRLHHSSFFGGGGVHAAVLIECHLGELKKLFPHSGHYRPQESHLCSLLEYLIDHKVKLQNMEVDVQRVFKVSRLVEKDGSKGKKVDSKWMMNGDWVFHFLCHKQRMLSLGVFDQLLSLKKVSNSSFTHNNATKPSSKNNCFGGVDDINGMEENIRPSDAQRKSDRSKASSHCGPNEVAEIVTNRSDIS